MKSKLTIKDIARELNVSISTVSKALKDSHEISTETKERIKAFADFHNYKPNRLALKLRSQKTLTIGVIIPAIVHHFFSTVLRGIDNCANEKGYGMMVCISNDSYEGEIASVETLLDGSVDGILVSTSHDTQQKKNYSHIHKLIDEKFPLVLFDNITDDVVCDKVSIDDSGGAYKATEYLIQSGCKRIALLAIPKYVKIGQLRMDGYKRALEKNGIALDKNLILELENDVDIQKEIRSLFKEENNYPDAILAVNGEIYASTAMQIAKDKGLKVPEDISIITFTNGMISKYASPPLTALEQHGYEMGKQAVELLIDRIESKESEIQFQKKVISTNLKIRKSTRNITE